jgi:hypothetical protein
MTRTARRIASRLALFGASVAVVEAAHAILR